jgi:hypothetical protein
MTDLENPAMKELVEGGKLKRADILLTHTKGSLLGALIRFGTGSYWNHALMIYAIRDINQGYNTTFIIESGGSGIDVHNIAHYLEKQDKYDVAVKRFEAPWFQDDTDSGGLRYRRKVRGFALQEIDDKYDHGMIVSIAARILRQIILSILFPLQRRKPPEQRKVKISRFAGINVNAYICSGFVQWAYYQAVSRITEEDNLDQSRLQEIIFSPRMGVSDQEGDLLSTTPADLATSDKLSWKYVIINGNIQEVSSPADVDGFIKFKGKRT